MQLSVIILNYNVRYFLEQCVHSVQKALQGIDGEIIVVDNNSPDDSCAMMREKFPDVKLIANTLNTGFPKGNNIGVARAKGDYICILNPDTVVAEDTFVKILEFIKSKGDAGITGVKLIDGTGCFLPESKRGVPTPWVAATKISGLYKFLPKVSFFNKYYAQHLSENESGRADVLVGAFMLMKRELYLEAGGFDERYFMYGEDIDLSYTVFKKGLSNYYFAGTSVIHYKGESTSRDMRYMERFREAMKLFYRKHFRKSPVFDLFMRGGSLFFVMAKKNKKVHAVPPENYILFSANEALCNALEVKLQKKVRRLGEYRQNMLISQESASVPKTEVIFDNELLSYGEIIAIMQNHSSQGYTFKIKPEGCTFIIGSNSSDGRGEVIQL